MTEIKDVESLGELVRAVRKEQGVTQVELSQLTNLGSRFVLDLESGKHTIQLGKTLEVLKTLGVRLYFEKPGESAVKNG